MIVVLPCAGFGTRMGRLTQVIPKEILPFGEKLLLDFILEELKENNIKEIYVIIRKGKEIIKDYLLDNYSHLNFYFIYQNEPKGIAHAYLQLKGIVKEPFLAILPDHLAFGDITKQILNKYYEILNTNKTPFILKTYVTVPEEEALFSTGKKPEERHIPIRSTGRTIYPPEFLEFISERDYDYYFKEIKEKIPEEKFAQKFKVYSISLKGIIWDIGTLEGYLFYLRKFLGERKCEYY